jgi:hypothetical protein
LCLLLKGGSCSEIPLCHEHDKEDRKICSGYFRQRVVRFGLTIKKI